MQRTSKGHDANNVLRGLNEKDAPGISSAAAGKLAYDAPGLGMVGKLRWLCNAGKATMTPMEKAKKSVVSQGPCFVLG